MTTHAYDFIVSDQALAEHLHRLLARPEWHQRAACRGRGAELFVPPRGIKSDRAKAICATCPVRRECLEFARGGNEVGTWGGLSLSERTSSSTTAA